MQSLTIFAIICSLTFSLVNGCGRRRGYRDRTAPTLTCPGDITELADKIQVNTKVEWEEPIAIDEKDGRITPRRTGPRPGSIISENPKGTTITYTATDRSGNYRSCSFKIYVTVTRCKEFTDISDGWKICHPSHDMRRGGRCRFGCYEGHRLRGDSSVTCQDSGLWTNEMQPFCEKLTCPLDDVLPADEQTSIDCSDENYFRSICTYSCQPGFDVLPGFSRVKVCTKYGLWNGQTPLCVDTEPPKFQNCPSVKKGYADRSRTTGRIRWDDPLVSDNSGSVYLKQTGGPKAGDELGVGQYTVTYTAYDDVNNTAECTFEVVVKQILCPTVYPLPYTSVVCPSGRIFGSSCVFSCDNGTAINGHDETQCEKQGSVHFYGQWTFGDHQPYCTLTSMCPELSAPGNGALACDVWMDGDFCQTFCRSGYTFNTQTGYELHKSLLVCGDSGTWWAGARRLSGSEMPDCVPETRASKARFSLTAVYYFDGPCETALEEIKEKFIERFTTVRGCEQPDKCVIENVEVTCGHSTDRKRREVQQSLTFSATMSVQPSSEDVAMETLQQREQFKNLFREFDDPRLTYESDKVSAPTLLCPPGFEPNYQEYKCAECPKGFYQNSQTNDCEKCPFGYYQPSRRETSCRMCPLGKTTASEGAYDEVQCDDACDPGYFSASGIEPCSPCDIGFYTSKYGSRECTSCPGEKISRLGATYERDCFDFDFEFKEDVAEAAKLKVSINATTGSFAIGVWVYCTSCNNILSIADSEHLLVAAREEDSLIITVTGEEYAHDKVLSTTSLWKYVSMSIDGPSLSIKVGEKEIISSDVITPLQLSNGTEMHVTVGGSGFLGSISHLNVWSSVSSDSIVASPKCIADTSGDLVSWREFAELDGDFVQTRSKCDDFDNCLSGPCQNEALCSDALNTYLCSCLSGFTGFSCETNIDDCRDHACVNGAICVDGIAGYDCLCPENFKGAFCEIKVVDGNWSDWEDYGPCTVSCGAGIKTRVRTCSNPTPDHGGKPCEGEMQETAECENDVECLEDCDVDPSLGKNGNVNCTWVGTTRVCRPFCNEGFDFDTDMYLDDVVCGLETGFTWNIKTEDNPAGQLPSCVAVQMATKNTMYYKGIFYGYGAGLLTQDKETEIKRNAEDKVAQTGCVKDRRCAHLKTEVGAYSNDDDGIMKREVQDVSFIVYISCNPAAGTDDCYNLLKDAKETLDGFVQQQLFSVDVGSTTYYVDSNSTSVDGVSSCEPGFAPVFYYCVSCGEGTYQLEAYCELCPRGTYQDKIGQTTCKDCPEGWSTTGLMSRDKSMCTVPVDTSSDSLEIWMIVMAVVIPALVCCCVVIVLVAYCNRTQKKRRARADRMQPYNNITVKELTSANLRFDKSRLFNVEHPSDYGCHYPEMLTVYPSCSSPPPLYETSPATSIEKQLKVSGI